jgi:G3E family GTPase
VLVDSEQFEDRLDDPDTGPSVRQQLAAADLFVLTKLDLATPTRRRATETRLAEEAPGIPVLEAGDAVAAASFLDLGTRRPGGVAATPPPALFDAHDVRIQSVPTPIARHEFEAMIAALPPTTLRAKGIAVTPDGTRLLAQVVGRRSVITALPDAEAQEPTDLVVITPRR